MEDFAIFPAVSQISTIFRVLTFFVQFQRCFQGVNNAFWQQILGVGIFSFNFLKALEVSRKSEAASQGNPLVRWKEVKSISREDKNICKNLV